MEKTISVEEALFQLAKVLGEVGAKKVWETKCAGIEAFQMNGKHLVNLDIEALIKEAKLKGIPEAKVSLSYPDFHQQIIEPIINTIKISKT